VRPAPARGEFNTTAASILIVSEVIQHPTEERFWITSSPALFAMTGGLANCPVIASEAKQSSGPEQSDWLETADRCRYGPRDVPGGGNE